MLPITDKLNISSVHAFRLLGRAAPGDALHLEDGEGAAREEVRHVTEQQNANAR